MPICKPNYAFPLQTGVLCQWEHVIEYFPFGLMDKNDDTEEYLTRFLEDPYPSNLTEQIDILKGLQGKKLSGRLIERLDFGGCPIFGHVCPGGIGQAGYCRSLGNMLDSKKSRNAPRNPLDYLLSNKKYADGGQNEILVDRI